MSIDIIQMLGNIGRSLPDVMSMLAGFGYIMGIIFVMIAIGKFRKIGDFRARGGGGEEPMMVPVTYLVLGAGLVFSPSFIRVFSNTLFGTTNALEYTPYTPGDLYNAIKILVQTAGLIWFLRGMALIVGSSKPGGQHGGKGMAFVLAGILGLNIESTWRGVESVINWIISH